MFKIHCEINVKLVFHGILRKKNSQCILPFTKNRIVHCCCQEFCLDHNMKFSRFTSSFLIYRFLRSSFMRTTFGKRLNEAYTKCPKGTEDSEEFRVYQIMSAFGVSNENKRQLFTKILNFRKKYRYDLKATQFL